MASEPVLLYAHPTMDTLARAIVERCSGSRSSQQTLTPEITDKTPVSTCIMVNIYILNKGISPPLQANSVVQLVRYQHAPI